MSRIFGSIHQIGDAVPDLDSALEHWTKVLGIGPFYYIDRVPLDSFRYRGKDLPAPEFSVAIAYSGALQIELIQQHDDAPSMYRDFLASGGAGLQHIAYQTAEFARDYARLIELGYKPGQEGQVAGGPDGRFAYFDTETHGGTVIEVTTAVPGSSKVAFYDRVRDAAKNWDGTEPVRKVSLGGDYWGATAS